MNSKNLNIVESLIFLSSEPFKQEDLNIVYEEHAEVPNLEKIVTMLNKRYTDFSYQIEAVSGGYLFVTKEEYEPFISKIYPSKKLTLSKASLEVLAIIAYKQPISRQEIEEIRGVDCKGLIKNLLLKNLIKIQKPEKEISVMIKSKKQIISLIKKKKFNNASHIAAFFSYLYLVYSLKIYYS